MTYSVPITIVDLFAGPGGLGEGFSSLDNGSAFKILVSAEIETSAHQTLQLRSYFRHLKANGMSLDVYYRFCNGESPLPYDTSTEKAWNAAKLEARQIRLGSIDGNLELNKILDEAKLGVTNPWVLIGGPPCQAYSLVGRSRNLGKENYKAEEDDRHFLYQEYLKIIQKYKPAVFVMENVKGILSAKINNKKIFQTILQDLSSPDEALGQKFTHGYKIYSLSHPICYEHNNSDFVNPHQFIIRAEEYGIPQARHRVILLGVRDDLNVSPELLKKTDSCSVDDVIQLPKLRSKLSKEIDSASSWHEIVKQQIQELINDIAKYDDLEKLKLELEHVKQRITSNISTGALRVNKQENTLKFKSTELSNWYIDDNLKVWLNHEARGHMASDLRRYVYASSYAKTYGISPKGHEGFYLEGLRPNHKNWESGKFSDRFRVQVGSKPATTITSHISKDGHYFIHPDPSQCRSFTVREAARIQTFPDNYFFLGNRTQQFTQVGNAVPPLLANKIANIVKLLLQ
jgi:DNA (cytosine-5)-methyltransferase 1